MVEEEIGISREMHFGGEKFSILYPDLSSFPLTDSGGMPERSVSLTGSPESVQ